jgi:CheY-like chemotaxis protein
MTSSNKQKKRILVLEPDEQLASSITTALSEATPDALIEMSRSLAEAQQLVLGVKPDLFVLDVDATPDSIQDFLFDLRTSHSDARAIVLTGMHLPAREQATGLGAIHFLEKPFPQADFVDLVKRLLAPPIDASQEKFQGSLRDLHVTDIIQIKCMSGSTSAVEFTGPRGEKARLFFENGQIRHATAPGREGLAAFNEILNWKGGTISEIAQNGPTPQTIDSDWQVLLMEGTRTLDERGAAGERARQHTDKTKNRKVLVTDDSLMLLSFVQEVLIDAKFDVTTAATGEECLRAAEKDPPDLILLDFILPDMKGDEVCRKLLENPRTAGIRIVYMSGIVSDLRPEERANPNVIGFLNKPFTSDLLIQTVENHMPQSPEEPQPVEPQSPSAEPDTAATELFVEQSIAEPVENEPVAAEPFVEQPTPAEPAQAPPPAEDAWWTPVASSTQAEPTPAGGDTFQAAPVHIAPEEQNLPDESVTGGIFFCGDTRFFSLHNALQTIADQKLTGALRSFWNREPIDLLVQNGQIVLATSRDPELYCPEAPVTLTSVDPDRIASAREQQRQDGCPLFITLANENLISQEPAAQLVQHHGQQLFAQLWTLPRVRFSFQQETLPSYAHNIPAEPDVDQWALATLRLIHELGNRANYDPASIPAYTSDGYERIQRLRLTVGEAQFASQFNGVRSLQQIAKNLRLDLNFARATLFRFVSLGIVECWPPTADAAPQSKGVFHRLARTIGIGE